MKLLMVSGCMPIKLFSIGLPLSTSMSSKRMSRSLTWGIWMHSEHWSSSLTPQKSIPIQLCHWSPSKKTFQLCSDVLLSMRHWVQLVRFTPTLQGGTKPKQKQRLRARSSKSVHPFHHEAGTNQPPFMRACGKTGRVQAFSSRSGRAHVGVGSEFASLDVKCQRDSGCAVHNWYTEVVGGTCTRLLKRKSKALSK